MKRIFRGKTLSQDEHFDDGEWVEGYYTCFNGKEHRIYSGYSETDCGDYYPDWFNVRPETVGQYTGLLDKDGKKVFEGDIISFGLRFCVVKYDMENARYMFYENGRHKLDGFNCETMKLKEVIGNVFDNAELIEVN